MLKKIRIKRGLAMLLIMLFVIPFFYPIMSHAMNSLNQTIDIVDTVKSEVEETKQDSQKNQVENRVQKEEKDSSKEQPIDITTDLVIDIVQTSLKTKTMDGSYDIGSPKGTYLPGKDFSENDDVSKGNSIGYTIGVSLSSKANKEYPIEKMYIEIVNEVGIKTSPFYYINTNANSENLVPDGKNTIANGQTARSSSIILGANDGITSTSTSSLELNFLVQNCYWKTRLMPRIRIVCEKNGQKQISHELDLTPVKMSSKAQIKTTLNGNDYLWSKLNYQTIKGVKGFLLPFQIRQNKEIYPNCINLMDNPTYTEVEYPIAIQASIEDGNIPITTENIIIQNSNTTDYEILSHQVENGILKVKLLQKNQNIQGYPNFLVSVFLPYDRGDKKEVMLNMNSSFGDTIKQTNFMNESLFSVSQTGKLDRTVKISFEDPAPPMETLKIKEEIIAGIGYNSMAGNSITMQDTNFVQTKGSQFVVLLDSEVVSFNKDAFMYAEQNHVGEAISQSDYTVSYANVSYETGYNPNTIGRNIVEGIIPVGTYEEVTTGGKRANAIIFTLTKDVLTGPDFENYSIRVYGEKLVKISSEEFTQLYQDDPNRDFTGYAYSYTSLNTNLASIEEANTQYGKLLSDQDDFSVKNGSVYLNWGTTKNPQTDTVKRFNDNSMVRKSMTLPIVTQTFNFGIFDQDSNKVRTVEDYSKEYQLILGRAESDYTGTNTVLKKGTQISFSVDEELAKNMFISNTPYLKIQDEKTGTYTKIDIQEYSHENGIFKITLPLDFTMTKQDKLVIPTSFIVPYYEKDITSKITLSKEVYLAGEDSIFNGFSNTTPYYQTIFETFTTKLLGAQTDSTGLTVTPKEYANGNDVKYIAKLLNQSFTSSDYYMGMTVPTNKYSPVDTSNNELKAYIKDVFLYDRNVEVYYQTEDKVTDQDIAVFKEINESVTLKSYYNGVVKDNWTKYDNNALPNNVVMMIGFAKDVKKGEFIRIDYDVNIAVEKEDMNQYTNHNVITYYSTGSTLETRSNQVTVHNIPTKGMVTVKYLEKDTKKELAVAETLTGTIKEKYQTKEKDFAGYTLIETPNNSTGEFTKVPQEVIYEYTKNPIARGEVTVKYLERDTRKELAAAETLTGTIKEKYQTKAKDFAGYILIETPNNSTGEFAQETQEVLYEYIVIFNTGRNFNLCTAITALAILIVVAIVLCIVLHSHKEN